MAEANRPGDELPPIRILHLEDSGTDHELLLRHLKKAGRPFTCKLVDTRAAFAEALADQSWDVVISDYTLGELNGLDALAILRTTDPDIPFIMVSGSIGEELAAQTMKLGASDYLMKDNFNRLMPTIERELREAQIRREKRKVEAELKTKELELIQSQKMDALGRLAGGVAHDFNNLLAVISLNADSIAVSSEFKAKADEIRQAVDRGASLVRQLLTFSKRGILPEEESVSINEVISQMHPMLKRLLKKNIQVEIQLQEGLPMVPLIPSHVEQVLLNLVVNARDAIGEQGTIKIRTSRERRLDRNGEIEREYCALEVADSGCGMSEETKRRIFEPFFTTKGIGKGTGLGLSTVYGIVERSESMITVDSAPGAGTTFRLFFPLQESFCQIPEPSFLDEGTVFRSVGTKVLLVEADGVFGATLAESLNKAGCITTHVVSSEVALMLISEKRFAPDILIADVSQPGISGLRLIQIATHDHGLSRALLISAERLEAPLPKKVENVELGFMRKPLSVQAVLSYIDGSAATASTT